MQKPRPGLDEEDDTAFGGLAPRGGPGGQVPPKRRGGVGKWVAAALAAAILILVLVLYMTGRL